MDIFFGMVIVANGVMMGLTTPGPPMGDQDGDGAQLPK